MERNRQTKIIAIVALVVAIAEMSLGFAAFSTTLSISSSASVTPSNSSFYLGFYASENLSLEDATITPTSTGSAIGSIIDNVIETKERTTSAYCLTEPI